MTLLLKTDIDLGAVDWATAEWAQQRSDGRWRLSIPIRVTDELVDFDPKYFVQRFIMAGTGAICF
jgi:hypothetical protein